jgi:hypothetical protein
MGNNQFAHALVEDEVSSTGIEGSEGPIGSYEDNLLLEMRMA